jgi:hypothetical protein
MRHIEGMSKTKGFDPTVFRKVTQETGIINDITKKALRRFAPEHDIIMYLP